MQFYLSSYRLGSEENTEKLKNMIQGRGKKIAYIPNALDFVTDKEKREKYDTRNKDDIRSVGVEPETLDLRKFFGKKDELKKVLESYEMLWVSGGNVFVLRQAMQLSGLDEILTELFHQKKDLLYCGYSAGVCVLGPTMRGYAIVDDATLKPYGEGHNTIWSGLDILPYAIAPHYRSDHHESDDIEKEVELMIEKKIPFIALRDGEVIIIEDEVSK